MKPLGVKQFQQMVFQLLDLDDEWAMTIGKVPKAFIGIVYGRPGNGKTEFLIRLAKHLTKFGKVSWLSYEQGHGFDLQCAINRNHMEEVSGLFIPIDPNENKPANVSYLEDLDNYLKKRNSPDFVFIDSIDYLKWKFEDYLFLKNKYGKKKTFIFISHARGNDPKTAIGEQIQYDGGIGILVSKYIAYPIKNRFGGFEPYVIWEKKARELNPLFFKSSVIKEVKPVKEKKRDEQPEQMQLKIVEA